MEALYGTHCMACGYQFVVTEQGSFIGVVLRCQRCQREQYVRFERMRGLCRHYQAELRAVQAPQTSDLSETDCATALAISAAYRHAVEALLEPCVCGGRYRWSADERCPNCGSDRYVLASEDALVIAS